MKYFFLLCSIALVSCKKNSNNCQTWKYYDECVPKSSGVVCNNPPTPNYITTSICGTDLNGVSAGSTKAVHEDADAKTVRHFMQKM